MVERWREKMDSVGKHIKFGIQSVCRVVMRHSTGKAVQYPNETVRIKTLG